MALFTWMLIFKKISVSFLTQWLVTFSATFILRNLNFYWQQEEEGNAGKGLMQPDREFGVHLCAAVARLPLSVAAT